LVGAGEEEKVEEEEEVEEEGETGFRMGAGIISGIARALERDAAVEAVLRGGLPNRSATFPDTKAPCPELAGRLNPPPPSPPPPPAAATGVEPARAKPEDPEEEEAEGPDPRESGLPPSTVKPRAMRTNYRQSLIRHNYITKDEEEGGKEAGISKYLRGCREN
jgi:hypothetical protein